MVFGGVCVCEDLGKHLMQKSADHCGIDDIATDAHAEGHLLFVAADGGGDVRSIDHTGREKGVSDGGAAEIECIGWNLAQVGHGGGKQCIKKPKGEAEDQASYSIGQTTEERDNEQDIADADVVLFLFFGLLVDDREGAGKIACDIVMGR